MYNHISLKNKKFLILLMILISSSFLNSGCGGTTSPPIPINQTIYRAYCVGVGDYIYYGSDMDLLGPPYDVNRICKTLSQCRFGSLPTEFSEIWYNTDWSATKSNILQGIIGIFSEADNNDVSYFYFSGHGSRIGNTYYLCPSDTTSSIFSLISVDELENALSAIPGTKVVLIDACHSGGFIGKGKTEIEISKEELASFNNEIINVFSQSESKGLLTSNQYKVLTSCHYYEECWEALTTVGTYSGLFTLAFCNGCGYSGSYPADTNLDTRVSLQEAYLYTKYWVNYWAYSLGVSQDVQVYPNNSTFPIVEY